MIEDTSSSTTKKKNNNNIHRGLEREPHIRYFAKALYCLSAPYYAQVDTNRLAMGHFAVHASGSLGSVGRPRHPTGIGMIYILNESTFDWIYNTCCLEDQGCFQGGSCVGSLLRTLFQSSFRRGAPRLPPSTSTTSPPLLPIIIDLRGKCWNIFVPSNRNRISDSCNCACSISWILKDWSVGDGSNQGGPIQPRLCGV